MHDVAKTAIRRDRMKSMGKTVLLGVVFVVALAGLLFALKLLGLAVMIMLVVVFTVLAIFFVALAFPQFRRGRTTSGALCVVLVLFCTLLAVKVTQFKQKEGVVQHKEVRAPFDGQLGIRQVNVGQMIKEGQQVVALTALDPVYVDFALPQQELTKLSTGLEVVVRSDAIPGREFKGKLTAMNSNVDNVTRNVTLQASLENPDHALRPGMFAKVEVSLPEKHKALVVPGSAISYAPFGDSVFVIETKKDEKTGKESQSIRQQFVKVGEARGDFVSITEGLKGNETIVSTGVFKLRNGTPVTINNELAPKPQVNPKPTDS